MTATLLLITHNNVGEALINTAASTLGKIPLTHKVLPISNHGDPDVDLADAQDWVNQCADRQGLLILTDAYGSTPSNIATKLAESVSIPVALVAGLNLPMLLRVCNYPDMPLDQLAESAVSAGQRGVTRHEGLK